ncbi:MAG: hypothetical protein WB402_00925 [Sulfuricaulis sp.]|uniref:hypothetical protein n=1 Tax=Sulfuricaulis sp. TaxID=2003553 RepID=UPI003C557EAD
MDIRVLFVDWTRERLIKAVGLILMVSFILFAWLNIGAGPTEEIDGTVRQLGMDTGVVFTLSRVIATVETGDGEAVSIEIPTTATVTIGSKLILEKRSRLPTSGHEYRFVRMAK